MRLLKYSCLIALLLISGCSSTPRKTHEYLLTIPVKIHALAHPSLLPKNITLMPIDLAGYLDGIEMVQISPDGQLFRAQNHLWAEPLPQQLQQITRNYLSMRLPTINWYHLDDRVKTVQLNIHINQFVADTQGLVHINGNWQLYQNDGHLLIQGDFNLKQPLRHDGYLAMTQSLSSLWETTLNQITKDWSLHH
ncbi:MAG: Intermembrane transport lipoprotein PqiC [Candidatus Celerinatantimonas neptuna]|nr:MAG: Intermembrane transport lipoprotein PqiC [Candidatus Celerinatantimonas neptuna]